MLLTSYKITMEDGYSYITSMAKNVTLEDAFNYFVGQRFEQDDGSLLMAVGVQNIKQPNSESSKCLVN